MEKEIAIFKTDKETINVEVIFEDETVWLTIDQMASLFEKSRSTINEHIIHIFEEGELDEKEAARKIGNSDFLPPLLSQQIAITWMSLFLSAIM